MLAQLQQNLSKHNHALSLQTLTNKSFVASLTSSDLSKLTKIVQGANLTGTQKAFHPKIALTLYCIIIMNGHTEYNTKQAVDFLCKYFRLLENQQIGSLNVCNQGSLGVIANLLLRVPTFSNYKLIVKYISPKFTPISLIMEHRDRMRKSCNHQFQQWLITAYKYDYPEIVTTPNLASTNKSMLGDQQQQFSILPSQNNPNTLHKELETLIKLPLQAMIQHYNQNNQQLTKQPELYSYLASSWGNLQTNMEYIWKRIAWIMREEIDVERLVIGFQEIMAGKFQATFQAMLSEAVMAITRECVIGVRNWVFGVVGELVRKCRFGIVRKVGWIARLVSSTLNNFHNQYQHVDLIPVLQLIRICYEVLGHGFCPFKKLLFTSDTSLTNLIKSLCLNPHTDTPKVQSQMNTQKTKKKSNPNNKIMLNLSLNPSLIDTPYQNYLSLRTSKQIREGIMLECLDLLIVYYGPHKFSAGSTQRDVGYVCEIVGILENSKNSLGATVCEKVGELNNVLFGGVGSPVQAQFWSFCSNTFDQLLKRRINRTLIIHKMPDIYIQPIKRVKREREQLQSMVPQISNLSHRNSFPPDNAEFRKTKSFDMNLEGWDSADKKCPNNSSKKISSQSVSQMFYSIKECSEDGDNQIRPENDEDFILTPNFD